MASYAIDQGFGGGDVYWFEELPKAVSFAIDVDLDHVLTFQRIRRLGSAWDMFKKHFVKMSSFNVAMSEVGETSTKKTSSSSSSSTSTIQNRRILSSAMAVVDQEFNDVLRCLLKFQTIASLLIGQGQDY